MTSQLCAEFLAWRGAKSVYFKDDAEGIEVAYGNSGIVITKDIDISVKDYTDFAIPEDFTLVVLSKVSNFFDNAFLSVFENHKRDSMFTSPLCFDVSENN